MIVNILHDSRRMERYEHIMGVLKENNIKDYLIHPCVMSDTVVESISLSFKMIVGMAKEAGNKECVIFEDDVFFPNKDGWQYFLKNKPKTFDVYIGGSYLIDNRYKYAPPTVRVNEWVGNHCIIIAEKYYDTFLALPNHLHIDTANAGKGDFQVCYPMPALQKAMWSSNNRAFCNYNSCLKPEDIYA